MFDKSLLDLISEKTGYLEKEKFRNRMKGWEQKPFL